MVQLSKLLISLVILQRKCKISSCWMSLLLPSVLRLSWLLSGIILSFSPRNPQHSPPSLITNVVCSFQLTIVRILAQTTQVLKHTPWINLVSLFIYEGDCACTKNNNLIGKFEFSGLPPNLTGVSEIEIIFDINANSILNISTSNKTTCKLICDPVIQGGRGP